MRCRNQAFYPRPPADASTAGMKTTRQCVSSITEERANTGNRLYIGVKEVLCAPARNVGDVSQAATAGVTASL